MKKKEIDWAQVKRAAEMQCTDKEIARLIDVSLQTLKNRCQKDNNIPLENFIADAKLSGKGQIRGRLFNIAMSNDKDKMKALRLLASHYLGINEKHEFNVKKDEPIPLSPEEEEVLKKRAIEETKKELRLVK